MTAWWWPKEDYWECPRVKRVQPEPERQSQAGLDLLIWSLNGSSRVHPANSPSSPRRLRDLPQPVIGASLPGHAGLNAAAVLAAVQGDGRALLADAFNAEREGPLGL